MNYKKDFPALTKHDVIYFDNGATTQKPKQVLEAINDYYTNYCANIHRGVYDWSLKASDEYESARETVAKFINAKPEEIIFVRNTTEGLNLISTLLKKHYGPSEIITSLSEHHSNLLPWTVPLTVSQKDFVKTIGLTKDFKHDINEMKRKTNENTRVIALNHVSNVLGIKNDLTIISEFCNEHNISFVVDGAQSTPHFEIDVKKLGCDAFAFSGHKMLGPTGIGVIYIKKELLDKLDVYQVGGGTIADVELNGARYAKAPSKYEAGTPSIADAIGLKAAIQYLTKVGMENIEEHEKQLGKLMHEGLNNLNADILGNTQKDKLGVFAFNMDGFNPNDLAIQLSMQNIYLRSGHHCAIPLHRQFGVENSIRASLYIYNTKEEVKKFLDALQQIVKQ